MLKKDNIIKNSPKRKYIYLTLAILSLGFFLNQPLIFSILHQIPKVKHSHNSTRAPANKKIKGKYGPEFSFTNEEIVEAIKSGNDLDNPQTLKFLEKWTDNLIELCGQYKCTVEETRDKHRKAYKVIFEDGWWLQVGIDVGCIEVQTKASTYETFKSKEDIMENFIFNSAKNIGLAPHERIGGGHLNMDLATAFNNDPVLFRNFIVDRANHPELVWGIFGGHLGNAPPIAALEPHLQDELKLIIEEFDQKNDVNENGAKAIQDLANQIQKRVYLSNPLWLAEGKTKWNPSYYQDMNFKSVIRRISEWLKRLELRGMRPQQNLNEFFLLLEFFEARLNHLFNLKEPLALNIPDDYEMPIEEKKRKFLDLLEETGLSKERFSPFLKGPIATGRVRSSGAASCHSFLKK